MLQDSTNHINRIIRKLSNVENYNFQEMQDLLNKLQDHNKTARNHRKIQVDFHKSFIDLENDIIIYDPELHSTMEQSNIEAASVARKINEALSTAEEKVMNERITISNITTHDSKELIYWDFTAGNQASDKNIYEVLHNHTTNHKLNRTSSEITGIILKKHIKGTAKLCIPEDITDFDTIKAILIRKYGNENDILTNLYLLHQKLGPTPPRTGSAVPWSKISLSCKEHLTLIRRADMLISASPTANNLINEKYVADLVKYICPEDRCDVLSHIRDDPWYAYQIIKNKFDTTLNMAQDMIRTLTTEKRKDKEPKNKLEYLEGQSEFAGFVANYSIGNKPECDICLKLRERGESGAFFENHIFGGKNNKSYNNNCPLYLKMTIEQRIEFLENNGFCLYCVKPNNTHNSDDCRSHNLTMIRGEVRFFKCTVATCPNRLELCITHKGKNMTLLKQKQQQYERKSMEFGLTTVELPQPFSNQINETIPKNDPLISKVVNWLNQAKHDGSTIVGNPESCFLNNHRQQTSSNYENNVHHNGYQEDLDSMVTTWEPYRPLLEKHKDSLLKNSNITSIINPDTRPIFMFMQLKGRTRGINLIFDSGASALITLNSIPGKELRACKNENQTIQLQGLGSTSNTAQSWTMALPLANNGNLVATEGYSVEHILGPLHTFEMSEALKLIKNNAPPDNNEIKQAEIYEYLSGNIEILAGIRLNALFPEKVFQLENGLALYRLKLASHNKNKMYCIGGPYEYVSEVGNLFKESAHFLKEVSEGLAQWSIGNTAKLNRGIHSLEKSTKIYKTKASMKLHRYDDRCLIQGDQMPNEITEFDLQNIDIHLDDTEKLNIQHCILCCDECNIDLVDQTEEKINTNHQTEFIKWDQQYEGRPNAFIAIKIKQRDILGAISKLQKSAISDLAAVGKDITPHAIEKGNLHLTLMVLQYKEESGLQEIFKAAMEITNQCSFYLTLESDIHLFPEHTAAFLKPTNQASDTIKKVHEAIKINMSDFDKENSIKIDNNLLTPHVTVFKNNKNTNLKDFGDYFSKSKPSIPAILGNQLVAEIELLSFKKDPTTGNHIKLNSFILDDHNNNCFSNHMLMFPDVEDQNWIEKPSLVDKISDKNIVANVSELIQNTPFVDPKDVSIFAQDPEYLDTNSIEKDKQNANVLLKNLQFIFDSPEVGYRCPECQKCTSCKSSLTQDVISMKEHLEEYLIEKSVNIDRKRKCFIAALPLTQEPSQSLGDNTTQTKIRHKRVLQKLNKFPKDLKEVKAGFNKLIDLGYIRKLKSFSKEKQEEILTKPGRYILPWDVVTKSTSYTTGKRQIFDAGSKTNTGNALNDIICKGKPRLDFDPMVLNFVHEKYAICADLQKFYQSVHLHEDHYHLQLMWWTDSMLPTDEPELHVVTRITFGLKSSSQQLEYCVKLLADENKNKPILHRLLTKQRFVDDLMGSYDKRDTITELIKETDTTLSNYGMKVKAYCQSYEKPSLAVSDGDTLVTGGMIWKPELDVLFIRIQPLHYSKKNRGQIMTSSIFENGSYSELNEFVPKDLTLRQVLSRSAQIYDPLGKLTPWKTGIKTLVRESLNSVNRVWDAPLSQELRDKWVQKFWEMQLLKEIGFQRNTLPLDKVADNATLVCFCDAGKYAKIQVVYLLHHIENNNWHSQMLYAKSQLSHPNRTIPNLELESLHNGAIMLNKCYLALPNIIKVCLIGDSTISSYWVCKDTISLAPFQRNRVSDIRRLINIEDIYHCNSDLNVSDQGTKSIEPLDSILPGSEFNTGPKFLSLGISEAVAKGYLKTIQEVMINPTNKDLWKTATDGLAGKCSWPDELLVSDNNKTEMMLGVNEQWVSKISERYRFSNYILDPLKRTWPFIVRSLSIAFYFIHRIIAKILSRKISKIKCNAWNLIQARIFNLNKGNLCQTLTSLLASEKTIHPTKSKDHHDTEANLFHPIYLDQALATLSSSINTVPSYDTNEKRNLLDLFNNGIEANFFKSIAIFYFLKKGSAELERFLPSETLKKYSYKSGNILLSKNRWLETNQLNHLVNEDIQPIDFHIQTAAPVLDRHSPIAISLAMYFHHVVSKHAGVDRSYLTSQGAVYILQGQRLFEDICKDCIPCRIKIRQKYNQVMGPLTENQLTYGAVGRFLFLDVSGPYSVKLSPKSRTTRQSNAMHKVWLLHGVCVVSNYSVVQVLESYGTDSFVQAIHRISSYLGYPQIAFIDSSATEIKALTATKFNMHDAKNKLYDQIGITTRICATGPSSHARHGRIEKRIHLFKNYFERVKSEISSLTALGLYTLGLQAATYLNSAPLCTKKRVGGTVSSRLISPNSFLVGKLSNHRAPGDIPVILEDQGQMLENVQTAAKGMKEYFTLNIPDLLLRTTWHNEPKFDIKVGDLVLFMKHENAIEYDWRLGIVHHLEFDRDGVARIASITYSNRSEIDLPLSKEDNTAPKITKRLTRKSSHTIAKIHSINDEGINANLAYLNEVLKDLKPLSENMTKSTTNRNNETEPLRSDISLAYFKPQLDYLLEGAASINQN